MITIKRGDTFLLDGQILGDGVAIPGGIATWEITSQLRTVGDTLVDTLICTIVNPTTCTFTLEESAAGVTADWPLGKQEMDIRYAINGVVIHTETAVVGVQKAQTRPVAP
jgi:hypothetical protein